jgi:predicted SnoaL-like aldol condensation-catalyzing enzyme
MDDTTADVEARNKALVRRATEEFLGRRDVTAVERHFSPTYIQHNPNAPPGRAGVEQFFGYLFAALPDLEVEIDHLYAEGDRVFSFMTWRGTHRGSSSASPPRGGP